MSAGLTVFDASIQKTNLWLKDIMSQLRTTRRQQAYAALRAVLHALRDCLPTQEVAKLSAQMPLVVSGVLFDGWKPKAKPIRHTRTSFYDRLRAALPPDPAVDPHLAAQAVLHTLRERLTRGELETIRRVLPGEVRALWDDLMAEAPAAGGAQETPAGRSRGRGERRRSAPQPERGRSSGRRIPFPPKVKTPEPSEEPR